MNIGAEPTPSRQKLVTTVAWQVGWQNRLRPRGQRLHRRRCRAVDSRRTEIGRAARRRSKSSLPPSTTTAASIWCRLSPASALRTGIRTRAARSSASRAEPRRPIARAALESIAYQVADLLDAMRADAGVALSELRVDGGAATNDMLMQFQADLLGVPVVRPAVTETTALGAAYLAGLAVGYWPSIAAVTGQWRVDRRFEPRMPQAAATALRERWSAALSRSKGWELT